MGTAQAVQRRLATYPLHRELCGRKKEEERRGVSTRGANGVVVRVRLGACVAQAQRGRTFRRAVEVDDKLVLAIILSLYIVVTHHAARVENKREGREQRRGE